jgi:hypothetical protein
LDRQARPQTTITAKLSKSDRNKAHDLKSWNQETRTFIDSHAKLWHEQEIYHPQVKGTMQLESLLFKQFRRACDNFEVKK